MAITQDQIFTAADGLDATGQNPTLAAVRKALGGGSFTTISEAMTEWKARKAAKASPVREPAPAAITDRLAAFGTELWLLALELANAGLASEREAMAAAHTELEAKRSEAAELADQVSAELEEAKQALSQAATAEAAARGERDALRQELAEARLQAATLSARVGEIEKRAHDLNAELGRVNQQNTELVAALSVAARSGSSGRADGQVPT